MALPYIARTVNQDPTQRHQARTLDGRAKAQLRFKSAAAGPGGPSLTARRGALPAESFLNVFLEAYVMTAYSLQALSRRSLST